MRLATNRNPTPGNKTKFIRDRLRVAWYKIQNNLYFFFLNFFLHQNNIFSWQPFATWQPYQLKIKISYLQQQEKEKKQPKIKYDIKKS